MALNVHPQTLPRLGCSSHNAIMKVPLNTENGAVGLGVGLLDQGVPCVCSNTVTRQSLPRGPMVNTKVDVPQKPAKGPGLRSPRNSPSAPPAPHQRPHSRHSQRFRSTLATAHKEAPPKGTRCLLQCWWIMPPFSLVGIPEQRRPCSAHGAGGLSPHGVKPPSVAAA